MKQKFFAMLAATALIVGVASCDKNDSGVQNAETQSILVQFPTGTTISGPRAVEAPVTDLTPSQPLNNVVVFMLNGNAVVERHIIEGEDLTNIVADHAYFTDVPAAVNGVLVVANIPATDVTALCAKANVAEIEKYPFSVESQSTPGIGDKTMMGKTNDLSNIVSLDGKNYKEAIISLDALIARFEIGGVKAGTGIRNIKLESVWINNFYSNGAATNPTLYDSSNGQWDITPAANPAGSTTILVPAAIPDYNPANYRIIGSEEVTVPVNNKVYAFHLFSGNYVPHIIMLVSGQYEDDNYFLGWVTFNYFTDNDNNNSRIGAIVNNKIYKVGFSGITIDAKDITPDPELTKFDLAVKCTITDWTEVNVTPGID